MFDAAVFPPMLDEPFRVAPFAWGVEPVGIVDACKDREFLERRSLVSDGLDNARC